MAFCSRFQLQPLHLQEITLCRFVGYLTNFSLGYQTVRCYLSALRHLQICAGFPDPSLSLLPRLNYMLKGVHRAHCHPRRHPRLPITPDLLCRIYHTWSQMDMTMINQCYGLLSALGFFGFFRTGEFTFTTANSNSPHRLSPADIEVDSHIILDAWQFTSGEVKLTRLE